MIAPLSRVVPARGPARRRRPLAALLAGLLLVPLLVPLLAAGLAGPLAAAGSSEPLPALPAPNPDPAQALEAPQPEEAADGQPRFVKSACWFRVPRDRDMRCGFLEVPENRAKPQGRWIRLAVTIFEPDRERHPPVVYLTGGPGQPTYIETASDVDGWWWFVDREPWLRGRRLIVVDQRGVGLSQPALDCPGLYDPVGWSGVVPTPDILPDLAQDQASMIEACRDRLLGEGIELAAYNTRESAADVADLRRALEVDEWVLFGISYGTRLALTVLRDHPEGVVAAILDSVLPLEVDFIGESAASFEGAMEQLYEDCRTDSGCRDTFGDLRPLVTETVRRFDAAPLPLRLTGPGEAPQFLHVDGATYMWLLFGALYDWDAIERLPLLIYRTAHQDYRFLAERTRGAYLDAGDSDFAEGMQFSVGCNEEFPFYGETPAPEVSALYRGWVEGDFYLWACPLWPSGRADPAENRPVASEIPVLLLSGAYDPITPPAWAKNTLAHLPKGQFLEFQGIGHDVVDSTDCGGEAVADFLANPWRRPLTACVADMQPPYFVLDEVDW